MLLCAACGGSRATDGATTGTSASCVAPYVDSTAPDASPASAAGDQGEEVAPGGSITLYAHWYTTTCNDTGGDDPLRPMAPVRLTVTYPSGVVQHLGPFTPASRDMGFSARVDVPDRTPRGVATVRDDQQDRPYRFEVGDPVR